MHYISVPIAKWWKGAANSICSTGAIYSKNTFDLPVSQTHLNKGVQKRVCLWNTWKGKSVPVMRQKAAATAAVKCFINMWNCMDGLPYQKWWKVWYSNAFDAAYCIYALQGGKRHCSAITNALQNSHSRLVCKWCRLCIICKELHNLPHKQLHSNIAQTINLQQLCGHYSHT